MKDEDAWKHVGLMFILFVGILVLCVIFGGRQEINAKLKCEDEGGRYVEIGLTSHGHSVWGCVK